MERVYVLTYDIFIFFFFVFFFFKYIFETAVKKDGI